MPEVQVNGIHLYYDQHGEGAPVLCIHGTSSSAIVWGDAIKELAGRGRCIVYDRSLSAANVPRYTNKPT